MENLDTVQFTDLIKIAGLTAIVTLLWAVSVAFTYWDLHRRPGAGKSILILVVLVLPLIGFGVYLMIRLISTLSSSLQASGELEPNRATPLKRPVQLDLPTDTLFGSDLTARTIFIPAGAVSVHSGRQYSSPKYEMTVSHGADRGKKFKTTSLPIFIGREEDSLVRLIGDLAVSRRHAEIFQHEEAIRIRDLNSKHGTLVNGEPIQEMNLASGDKIQVGTSILIFTIVRG